MDLHLPCFCGNIKDEEACHPYQIRYYIDNTSRRRLYMQDRDKKIAAATLLVLAGGVIGVGLALLYAPQSGSRTRKDIFRYSKKVRNSADEAVDDLAANVSNLVETIGEKTEDILEKGRNVAGSARKDLIRLIEEGASKLEKFRTLLSRM
jgi:gas vesicle protein